MRHRTQRPTVFDRMSDPTEGMAARSVARRYRPALTLVELLLVIAVIAILIALLLPAHSMAKAKGREVTCLNNLKQLQICAKLYSLDNDDFLLPNRNVYYVGGSTRSEGFSNKISIFDSHFGIPPRGSNLAANPHWWDLPADRHSQGCSFSFADGHVERWRWVRPKIYTKAGQDVRQDGELRDWLRVQRAVKPQK